METGSRLEGLLAQTLWDVVIDVLDPVASRASGDPSHRCLKGSVFFISNISVTFVHTNQQISDKWTTGSFTPDKRDEPMILLCVVSESFITAATFPLSKLFSSCSSDGGKKPSVYWPSLEVHRQARRPSQSL